MTFAKCLQLNKSVKSIKRFEPTLLLPKNERTPIYRRQVGSVFSVEYSGEQRLDRGSRGGTPRGVFQDCLF